MFRSRSRTLEVREEREGPTVGYSPVGKPLLIVCGRKAMQRLPFGGRLLQGWGYRRWACDVSSPMAYYARPLPVWALLWTLERVRLGYWRLIGLLFDLGVIHIKGENWPFRWRDVRLGR